VEGEGGEKEQTGQRERKKRERLRLKANPARPETTLLMGLSRNRGKRAFSRFFLLIPPSFRQPYQTIEDVFET